jgi:hypothetical protein
LLNNEIHQALDEICQAKGINENTKKQIAVYLDLLSQGTEKKSDLNIRLANILKGISSNET